MIRNFFLHICCFLIGLMSLQAQTPESFSTNKAEFVKQVNSFLKSTDRDECKETAEILEDYLLSGNFSSDQFTKMRDQAEAMLKLKMRAYPHFESYFRSLNNMAATDQLSKFDNYLTSLLPIFENLKTGQFGPYKNYLKFAVNLFGKNALYMTTGGGWLVDTKKYTFHYTNDIPSVKFEEGNLIGFRKKDSIRIQKTYGEFFPLDNRWDGEIGEVFWDREGFGGDAQINFDSYTVNVKMTSYEVKESMLKYPTYFDKPIRGIFVDKIVVGSSSKNSYPRFESALKTMEINNFGEGIRYTGGFRLAGSDVIGVGEKDQQAKIDFFNNKQQLVVSAKSEKFIIRRGEVIVSQEAESSMFFEDDSIYHPKIDFKFDIVKRVLVLTRGNTGSDKTPFFDSHHNFDIKASNIRWEIDKSEIEIGKPGITNTSNDAILESLNFFDDRKYDKYQSIATTNPISQIRNYSEKLNTREIHGEDLATSLNSNYDLTTINSLLNTLVEDGFVYFDPETKMVTVKDKVFNWADASVEKIDYDIIRIRSKGEKEANGLINLEDNSLMINGVKNVIISDSQLVVLKPKEGKLKLTEDRNMEFDGQVYAGFGIFNGKNLKFDYNRFGFDMDTIKSFLIRIKVDEDMDGTPIIQPLTTRLENLYGSLQIDAPSNKSSRENIPEFPSFESTQKSRAYYQDRKIQNKAYKKDEFYFELDPFNFDSLDSFDPDYLTFDGNMHTANIFPQFKEKLRVQKEDLSLGFETQAPPGGFDIYNEGGDQKGKFHNTISLNNKGLIGKGDINYMGSEMSSDEILFLPDKMKAKANSFGVKEQTSGTEFPEVSAVDVDVDWHPYKDSMYIKSDDKPFDFFDGQKELEGGLVLTPGGLYGEGVLDWEEATLTSDQLLFKARGVNADTSNLVIKALDAGAKLALNTKNVSTKLDFDKGTGSFQSNNDKRANTEMPYNQYKTSLDKFDWDMKKQSIKFKSSKGAGGSFVSTKREQDSLHFSAASANYDLKSNILNIEGVPLIKVADAVITPSDGKVVIQADAIMNTLKNATIVANTKNKYHTINNSEVNITGRNRYTASGNYEYNVSGKEQEILFNNIQVKRTKSKKYVTTGAGSIPGDANFHVDDKIIYKGSVNLSANSKNLLFKGYAKIKTPKLLRTDWFSINTKVDRKNVMLEFENPKNSDGIKLHAGILLNLDSAYVYPSVLANPWKRKDMKLFTANGLLKHDKAKSLFMMGDSAKVATGVRRGNMLTFDETDGEIIAEGKFKFDKGFFGNLSIDAAGITKTNLENSQNIKFDLMMGINLPLPEKMLNIIADDLYGYGADLPDVNLTAKHVPNALAEYIKDDKILERAITSVNNGFSLVMPKESKYSLFFNKIQMGWDRDILSFVNSKKVGIHSINGKSIEKMITAYVDIQKIFGQQDKLSILIESPSDEWYFIQYQNRQLKTISSNEEYNDVILSAKKKDLKTKMDDGGYLEIDLSSVQAMNFFRARMR